MRQVPPDERLLLEALGALAGLVRELDWGEHMALLRARARRDGVVEREDVKRLGLALLRGRVVVDRLVRNARRATVAQRDGEVVE